jgi:hypothetical protein
MTIDGSDIDLYLVFASSNDTRREPGKTVYDYKSTGWSSVTEIIEISYKSPHYCYSCVVYLAVYGYAEGSYTLQASSNGIMRLTSGRNIGDRVNEGKYVYYSYWNYDQFAEMTVSLTSVSALSTSYSLTIT